MKMILLDLLSIVLQHHYISNKFRQHIIRKINDQTRVLAIITVSKTTSKVELREYVLVGVVHRQVSESKIPKKHTVALYVFVYDTVRTSRVTWIVLATSPEKIVASRRWMGSCTCSLQFSHIVLKRIPTRQQSSTQFTGSCLQNLASSCLAHMAQREESYQNFDYQFCHSCVALKSYQIHEAYQILVTNQMKTKIPEHYQHLIQQVEDRTKHACLSRARLDHRSTRVRQDGHGNQRDPLVQDTQQAHTRCHQATIFLFLAPSDSQKVPEKPYARARLASTPIAPARPSVCQRLRARLAMNMSRTPPLISVLPTTAPHHTHIHSTLP